MLAGALAACGDSEPDDTVSTQSQATQDEVGDGEMTDEEKWAAADAEAEAALTVHQPNETFAYGDWELTLGETDTDATQAVIDYQLEEYGGDKSYTTPPSKGNVYITVPVTATFTGALTGDSYSDPAYDLNLAYVSADGNTYGDILPVSFPNDLTYVGDLYPEGTGKGDVLQEVPAEDAEGGQWRISWNSMDAAPDSEVYVTTGTN